MMQCKSCGQCGKDGVSLLDPNHSYLLKFMILHIRPQVENTISTFLCQDCVNEVEQWRNFVNRFQSSQQHFHKVIAHLVAEQDQADSKLKAIKLPLCRVLVKKLLECDSCYFYTENKSELSIHIRSHHLVPYQAAKCRKSHRLKIRKAQGNQDCTQSQPLLMNSMLERKKRKFPCSVCQFSYFDLEKLMWHIKNCHRDNAVLEVEIVDNKRHFHCTLCKTEYKVQNAAMEHLHLEHKIDLPYKCSVCIKQYSCKSLLNLHKLLHENKIWTCHICHARFQCKRNLKLHMCKVHVPLHKQVKCKICNKTYKCMYYLKRHIAYCHAKNQHFKCKQCSKSFNRQWFLNDHYRAVHLKVLLQCSICEVEFKSRAGYNKHIKYQHANQNFECNICFATFTRPSNLQRHKKDVHTSIQKSASCKICCAKFKSERSLQQHVRNTHLGKFLYCGHCKFSSRRKYDIVLHLKRCHFKSQM